MIDPRRPWPPVARAMARLRGDSFLKAAGVLVGGTASAQLLAVLALPFLTRIFSAEDFSVLAVYVAILTMVAALTCMRLDTAIPLPQDDDEAQRLLVLALTSAVMVTVLLGLGVAIWGVTLAQGMGRADIAPYLWLVPIGVALMGFYSAFQYMAMRQKAFGLIARTRLVQALAGLGAQIGLGLAGLAPVGLLIGHALMSGAGVIALASRVLRKGVLREASLTRASLGETLNRYRRFPQYAVAEELTNNAGTQLPILLIGVFLIGPEAGFLFLAMRAVGTPMSVIGGAVSQVYYANAAEYVREGRLAEETTRVVQRLSNWLVLPMVFLGPFAPDVFRVAFGPEWERAGVLLVWMLPWYAFRLLVSPVSMVMYAKNLQHRLLGFATIGLVVRVLPLGVMLVVMPEIASATYAASSAVYYLFLLLAVLVAADLRLADAITLVARNAVIWIAAGAISAGILFYAGS